MGWIRWWFRYQTERMERCVIRNQCKNGATARQAFAIKVIRKFEGATGTNAGKSWVTYPSRLGYLPQSATTSAR